MLLHWNLRNDWVKNSIDVFWCIANVRFFTILRIIYSNFGVFSISFTLHVQYILNVFWISYQNNSLFCCTGNQILSFHPGSNFHWFRNFCCFSVSDATSTKTWLEITKESQYFSVYSFIWKNAVLIGKLNRKLTIPTCLSHKTISEFFTVHAVAWNPEKNNQCFEGKQTVWIVKPWTAGEVLHF
jgi:hypothetical protein